MHAPNHHRDPGMSIASTNGHGGPTNDTAVANNDVCASTTVPNNDWSTEPKTNGAVADEAWGTKTTTADSNEDGWIASADTLIQARVILGELLLLPLKTAHPITP